MGFFDRDVRDGYDRLFDYDHDGKLNAFEQAMQWDDLDRDISGLDGDEDENDAVTLGGLDDEEEILDEIEGMDEEEAREYLESEGYDPDDFDL